MRIARALFFTIMVIASLALSTTRSSAAPTAMNLAILEAECDSSLPAATLRAQLLAEPGVASVALIDGATTAPTGASLAPYEGVVAMGNCSWSDQVATGDALADYQDAGGVVIGTSFDWEGSGGYTLAGRWIDAGYSPFQPNAGSPFGDYTLGDHDASNPILAGVNTLSGYYYNTVALTSGATTIATWSVGVPGIAVKGHAVGINEYLGDNDGMTWSGQFGRVIVNAVKLFEKQQITVTKSGTGAGTVTGSAGGINCGSICASSLLAPGTSVALVATPASGSAFTGWGGACTGSAGCSVPATYGASVSASFANSRLKYGKYKAGKLSIGVPGAGKLTVRASGVKTINKLATKAGTINLRVRPTNKLTKKLAKGRAVKVKFKFAFSPTGAAAASNSSKTIKLKQ